MAQGRKLVIRRRLRNRVNRFTFEDYNTGCSYIVSANALTTPKTQVVVTHDKLKTATISSLILDVLKKYNLTVKRHNKYASSNKKYLFVFNTKEDAQKAAEIINKMAIPDYIVEENVKSNGDVTTAFGLKVHVDMQKDENGNVTPASGGAIYTAAKKTDSEDKGYTKWIVVGTVAVAAVAVIVIVLKKKKKI